MKKNGGGNQKNKWLVFTSMPIQMGITIYLFYRLGAWLDRYYAVSGQWWMKGLTMLGVAVSMYQFIKQVNYLNKNE
ncbi:putative F0F1-ATPase subunit (Ca2+/Mg2+ transporter) [Sphingobacterium allocomposti]|uniref:Putative F0F1-ATPase subunit (Ca2+/Mg2+ transporter) n=1 Tax=Sphingobacterium allocomposti TaxID=415956 RepID=A0A5S5CWT5_9SPHI|nr:AtpZ/AtpI family protein [Sphingobacterium composti Yoo et al. 2007 non Ten et al. 2007]TYP88270.1 putative F0F1-ATPase subunit (Ca2+/Mg2+ transporter) [Sphingobacterium composti Yoo et al. 2007 non Ten et al. 2007]